MSLTLEQAIEHATEALPDGWEIHLKVGSSGPGWVEVERPDMSTVDMHDDEADLVEQIQNAIRLATDEAAVKWL